MKRTTFLLGSLLLAVVSMAQGWNEQMYRQIEARIVAPVFKDKVYDVTKYGAAEKNSAAKNQKAINKAIEQCSKAGGGKVVVPAGTYMTGAITMKDDVNLVVEKGAVVKFAFEPALYPLVYTRYEGLDLYNYSPCIYANGAKNIGISGEGTIDGNGSNTTFWQWTGVPYFGYDEKTTTENCRFPMDGQTKGYRDILQQMCEDNVPLEQRVFGMGKGLRMQLVNFVNCENVLIEQVTMLNSPFWVMHPLFSKNITVRGVKVINEGPNGDGCDPESCEDVLIENCLFDTGDDCIAIKSGRNGDGRRDGRPSKNIIVRGCRMVDGHGGVVIGSEISGGCNNVFVENCKMDSPNLDRILRIKTNSCRGGLTENIYMRNVEVGQCREAVLRINLNYQPKEAAQRGFNPTVRNVWMENVTCKKSKYGVLINGLEDVSNIYNINIKNCRFDGVTDKAVERTGKSHGLNFDQLFINGSLMLLDKPYQSFAEWMAMSEIKRNPDPTLIDFATKPKWGYVVGIELESLLDTYLSTKNEAILDYLKQYPAKMISEKGDITGYKYEDFNLDNTRPARFILRMYQLNPAKKDMKALKTVFKQLEKQPRTTDGVWWHKAIYANQVWLDGVYMGHPFYTMGAPVIKGEKKAKKYYDDAFTQISKTFNRTYDEKTQLWKHAWDETHTMFWADKETGLSKHTWARAQGWYAMALLEVLDALPKDYEHRGEMIEMLNTVMLNTVKYQDKATGVWYDVMDVNSPKNYLEATASSMFAYVLLKGSRLGYFGDDLKQAGIKAYQGILKEFVKVNDDKTISLTQCCEVSGLGPGPGPYVKKPNYRRDGSFEYYISEPIRDNDGKGVGPFIWASLEMEKLGYNVSSLTY